MNWFERLLFRWLKLVRAKRGITQIVRYDEIATYEGYNMPLLNEMVYIIANLIVSEINADLDKEIQRARATIFYNKFLELINSQIKEWKSE